MALFQQLSVFETQAKGCAFETVVVCVVTAGIPLLIVTDRDKTVGVEASWAEAVAEALWTEVVAETSWAVVVDVGSRGMRFVGAATTSAADSAAATVAPLSIASPTSHDVVSAPEVSVSMIAPFVSGDLARSFLHLKVVVLIP